MTKFQLKYVIRSLLLYPALAWLFVISFHSFTRLILHVYANKSIIWSGYAELAKLEWIVLLFLIHLCTVFLCSMVLRTMKRTSSISLVSFGFMLSLTSVINLYRNQLTTSDPWVLLNNWQMAWETDAIPFAIEASLAWFAIYLSFKVAKALDI